MNETCSSCHAVLPYGVTHCPRCNASVANVQATNTDAATFMRFGTFGEIPAISSEALQYSAPIQPSPVPTMQQSQPPEFPALSELAPFQPPPSYSSMQAQYFAPVSPALPQRRKKTSFTVLLIASLLVLLLAGSGMIYYAAVAHPAALRAQATTVAKTLATSQAKASATAYASSPQGIYAYATGGSPTVDDSMKDAGSSLWSSYTDAHGNCAFVNGSFHITVTKAYYYINCDPITSGFRNMAYQVQMTILQGDAGGCIFYYTNDTSGTSDYVFEINRYGLYDLSVKPVGQQSHTLAFNRSSALKAGLNQPNLLTVIAINGTIYLYINKQYVTTVNDATLSEGNIGVFATAITDFPTQVAFSNAKAWDLP